MSNIRISHTAWAYLNLSVISSKSNTTRGIFLPIRGILVYSRLSPGNSPSSPDRWQMLVLNSWMKRGTATAMCLAQEFNPIIHPRPKSRGYWMKFSPFQYYLDSTTILTINTYILQHQYIYSPTSIYIYSPTSIYIFSILISIYISWGADKENLLIIENFFSWWSFLLFSSP